MALIIALLVVTIIINRIYHKIFRVVYFSFTALATEWFFCFMGAMLVVGGFMKLIG